MRKKGFTLIELLAVILILGIIALIAIPTVNKIITEAREGAFKTGVDNIVNSLKTKCQTSLIKGESPDLTYSFIDGKSNIPIDIKGDLPNKGYIILDNECELSVLNVSNEKFDYNTGDFEIEDQMLLSYLDVGTGTQTSIFNTLYSSYFSNIKSVKFIDNLNIPADAIEIKDVSLSGNGKVKSWLVNDNSKYILYVGSKRPIYANYDSSFLFNSIPSSTMDLNNLFTNFTTKMDSMFRSTTSLNNINLEHFYTANVTSMSYMFSNATSIESIYISSWDTRNVKSFDSMFNNCKLLKTLDLSKWNTQSLVTTTNMFYFCNKIQLLDLSNWNTNNLTNLTGMFDCCYNLITLKLKNWNVSKVSSFKNLFKDCSWLNVLELPKNMNVSNSNSFLKMFWNVPSLRTIDFSNWEIKETADFTNFFYEARNLTEIKFINSSDETIIKIGSILPSVSNGVIYVNEIKDTYPTPSGWVYQEV